MGFLDFEIAACLCPTIDEAALTFLMSHTAFGPVLELACARVAPTVVAVVEGIWVSDAGGYSIGPAASLIAALPTSIPWVI
jgi:hypothetical protein